MESGDAPGYRSTIHAGSLQPILIWRAPFRAVLYNILMLMWVFLMLTWRWTLVAVVVHVGLAVLWAYDPYLLASGWEARKFRHFLGSD